MRARIEHTRPGLVVWAVSVVGLALLLLATLRGPLSATAWSSAHGLFWLVTVGAGGCYLGALWTLVVGWRDGLAEVGLLGAALMVQSQLGLVHGVTAPGVLYGPSGAVSTSIFLALPAALVVAFPLIIADSGLSRWVARRWRGWAIASLAVATGLTVWLLARPTHVPAARMGAPVVAAVGVISLAVALWISWRQLELYWVGRRAASLAAAIAIASLGLSGLVWVGQRPFTVGWWLAHLLDVLGVLVASVALAIGYRQGRSVSDILAPVVARDPLVALRLGLSPVVQRFVADLNAKDPLTRDHVVRVAEMAVRAGQRAGIGAPRLRNLGLAAILHDIGKLDTPDEILTKPGRLTDDETTIMRTHSRAGEQMLSAVPGLDEVARLVRAHHERHDGAGYPDGLAGNQIPLEASIIAVCDAFDAMAHTRHYRQGMGPERALAVLREHAGLQWSPAAVDLVVAEIGSAGSPGVLWEVGLPADWLAHSAVCHALPTP